MIKTINLDTIFTVICFGVIVLVMITDYYLTELFQGVAGYIQLGTCATLIPLNYWLYLLIETDKRKTVKNK